MSEWLKHRLPDAKGPSQFEQAQPENLSEALAKARQYSKNQIENQILQTQAKQLEDFLNSLIKRSDMDDFLKKLSQGIDKTIQTVDKATYNKMLDGYVRLKGTSTIKSVKGNAINSALKAFESGNAQMETFKNQSTLARSYLQQLLSLQETGTTEELEAKIANLKHEASMYFGHITNLQKQTQELALQYISDQLAQVTAEKADDAVKQVLSGLKNQKISSDLGSAKTVGDETYAVKTFIKDDEIEIITSGRSKADVIFKLPKSLQNIFGKELTASAKNYSQFRDVHLLSGGNVTNLIGQGFGKGNIGGKYFRNAFGIRDWTGWPNIKNDFEKLILFQALSGQHGNQGRANIMINYFGDRVNPFRVVSTTSLLDSLMIKDNIEDWAKFKYSPGEPPLDTGAPRKDFSQVDALTVSVVLSKEALKVRYLASLK